MQFVFGPILSRRLGRSLGIDFIPFKHCTQDCIYCQLGKTTKKTSERNIHIPPDLILQELKQKLHSNPDFITITGSGEPTLCQNLGEIIKNIKSITDIPLTVLTNGTLLHIHDVRKDLLHADVVCPSLDAGNENTFKKINRPSEDIDFKTFLNGLIEFRKEYKGKIWLEIMLIKGINDSPEELKQIANCAFLIHPDKIHLNTITRPPAEINVVGLSPIEMEKIREIFNPPAEIIADLKINQPEPNKDKINTTSQENINKHTSDIAQQITEILQRHPCSSAELSTVLQQPPDIIKSILDNLLIHGKIVKFTIQDRELFRIKNPYEN